jgi:hypothetical protein
MGNAAEGVLYGNCRATFPNAILVRCRCGGLLSDGRLIFHDPVGNPCGEAGLDAIEMNDTK